MMHDTRGLTVRDWIITLFVFSGVFVLGTMMIYGASTSAADNGIANNITNGVIESHYNQLSGNIERIQDVYGQVNSSGGLQPQTGYQAFLGSTIGVLNIGLLSINELPSMMYYAASDFGLNSTVMTVFLSIVAGVITIAVVFAILNASKLAGRV